MEEKNMPTRFSHRGICVSDLEASTRFYAHGLGFEPVGSAEELSGEWLGTALELDSPTIRTRRIRNSEGIVFELTQFLRPSPVGSRERRSNNQFGLTHLAWYVHDIDAVAERALEAGGRVYPHTRAHYPAGGATMLYCTDPDGARIELMHHEAAGQRFSHSGILQFDHNLFMRFYREVFGFETAENHDLQDQASWLSIINELPDTRLRAQMVRDACGNTIELLGFYNPAAFGPKERLPRNQLGFNHLAFWSDDLDATAEMVRELGGKVHQHTRARSDTVEYLACSDPVGCRLQLMKQLA